MFGKKKECESDINKFSLFTMELILSFQNDALRNSLFKTIMTMRDYELKELVVAELKEFEYKLAVANFNEVDNDILLEKIQSIINGFDEYIFNN
jgi:hypothetical protein